MESAGSAPTTPPLGQRTTGSRSRRCQESQQVQRGDGENNDDSSDRLRDSDVDDGVGTVLLRRPRPEIESRIDAAIEARKQQRNALEATAQARRTGTAATETKTNSEEFEVLGDYEYLDHTADVQIHGWGNCLERALEQVVIGVFGYMTRLELISISEADTREHGHCVEARGHDAESLAFAFAHEWLSVFHETGFVPRRVRVVELDEETWRVTSTGEGEVFDPSRHAQGTEVKAITYSNLQVVTTDPSTFADEPRCDIWMIVDI